MERSILHCDMNHFYAAVEVLYDPSLRGKPVAVCGDEEARQGIVLAKSDEAKARGIRTGDTVWQAREKCPGLCVVPPHFERYVKYSRLAKQIYLEYTDLVEPFGLDECWLDVTASRLVFGDGVKIGDEIRNRIRKELGLTISVGVSFNKVFAKLGSDLKKPDALTHIPREATEKVVWGLPVESMLGVGRQSAKILHRFGIHTLGALATADDLFLKLQFGKNGALLKNAARGEDRSLVLPASYELPMKSVGHGATTPRDLATPEEVWTLILALTQEIGRKLRFHGKIARGVAIECKDRHFFKKILQKKLPFPTNCTGILAKEAFALFSERYVFREPLRAVTVRAIDLEKNEGEQLSLFTGKDVLRAQRLDQAADEIRERFGKGALTPARLLRDPVPEKYGYIPFHGA